MRPEPAAPQPRDRSGTPGRMLERGFAAWGRILARAPTLVVLSCLALGLALASGLPQVEFDTHAERFLSEDHPARIRYEEFKREFGLDTAIFVLIETDQVFKPRFLSELKGLHQALSDGVPFVDEVRSLVNARDVRAQGDELAVGRILARLPGSPEESADLAERVLSTRALEGRLVSGDRRNAVIAVRLAAFVSESPVSGDDLALDAGFAATERREISRALSATEARRAVRAVRQIVEVHSPHASRFHLVGNPVVNEHLGASLAHDMSRFTALALGAIALSLAWLFRRASAVVLPLAVVLLSILGTLGSAGLLDITLNVSAQILPPFLLATGVSASVHLLVLFYRAFDAGASAPVAIERALGHAGPAVMLTGLTTAGGLASFLAAGDLAPVRVLGIFAPLGVALGLFFSMTLLPALLIAIPLRRRGPSRRRASPESLGRSLADLGLATRRMPRRTVALCVLGSMLAASGIAQLDANNDALAYFPDGDPVREATQRFDRALSGSLGMEVLIDTGEPDGLKDPALIAALDGLEERMRGIDPIDGARILDVISIADILRETHGAITAAPTTNAPSGSSPVPTTRAAIAQELLLFEAAGSDEVQRLVSPDYSVARVSLYGPWVAARHYRALIPRIEAEIQRALPESIPVEVHTTGLIPLFAEAVAAISRAFVSSYGLAMVAVTLLMIGCLGSLRPGLVSMLPNLLPIFWVLGLMGWTRIDLDLFTMLIGSIGIGIAVDDTIHLSLALRRFHRESQDVEGAMRRALETTGSAILTSSVVLGLGFASFALSSMANLVAFGLLIVLCITLALAADVLLLPLLASWMLPAQSGSPSGRPAFDPTHGTPSHLRRHGHDTPPPAGSGAALRRQSLRNTDK